MDVSVSATKLEKSEKLENYQDHAGEPKNMTHEGDISPIIIRVLETNPKSIEKTLEEFKMFIQQE